MSILINNPKYEIRATPVNDIQGQARHGFSLTEVLIAVGLLAMGMLFIAGAFPVSIHFTTVATERTIAPIVADEAFAKLRFYGPDFKNAIISPAEFAYPSTQTDPNSKQYWWALLYGPSPIDPNTVDVLVFVFRKTGLSSQYWVRDEFAPDPYTLAISSHPSLILVGVSALPGGRPDELLIGDLDSASSVDEASFINDGYTIVDNDSGRIYRVLERYYANQRVIRLDKDWAGPLPPSFVWVTSPPVNSGRYPCIGVYQKVMRF